MNPKWFKRNLVSYGVILVVSIFSLSFFRSAKPESDLFGDMLVGVVSSILLIVIIEFRDFIRDRVNYGYLDGKYKREARFNENKDRTSDTKWSEVLSKDDPNLLMIYKGGGEYKIPEIHYDEQWTATATIFLDTTNRKYGSGSYQYIKKHDSIKVDLGTYQLFVDELDNRRLYVFHQNYLPSGLSVGYEIWVRQ